MLRCHSHYSLLRAYGSPKELVLRTKELGHEFCTLTDIRSISGCVEFYEQCVKEEIKPIMGCDFEEFSLLAKNKEGWHELIKILSEDNPKFEYSPNIILLDHTIRSEATGSPTIDFFDSAWVGSKNYFVVLTNNSVKPDAISCPPSYYLEESDAEMLEILLSSKLKRRIQEIKEEIKSGDVSPELLPLAQFFDNSSFSLQKNIDPKIQGIVDSIEEYNILSTPKLPHFDCPDGKSEIEYLRELCRIGWKKFIKPVDDQEKETYRKRVVYELDVIEKADLAGYFLIVRDFIDSAKQNNQLVGPARGSAAGSLVAFLVGITEVNPIPYGLIFERFYDPSRAYPKHLNFDEYKFVDDFRSRNQE